MPPEIPEVASCACPPPAGCAGSPCPLVAACSLTGAAAATPASAASTCSAATTARAGTLCLINAERSAHGLRSLKLDAKLNRAARRHSQDMVAGRYFAHDSRSGARFSARIARTGWMSGRGRWSVGENLAWGTGTQAAPRSIVASWMRSADHRHNILSPRFRVIGIGIVRGAPVGAPTAPPTPPTSAADPAGSLRVRPDVRTRDRRTRRRDPAVRRAAVRADHDPGRRAARGGSGGELEAELGDAAKRTENVRGLGLQSRGKGQVRGNGWLVLTDDELRFKQWIPDARGPHPARDAVTEVETPRVVARQNGRAEAAFVRWRTPDGGEDAMAWEVRDVDAWLSALQ